MGVDGDVSLSCTFVFGSPKRVYNKHKQGLGDDVDIHIERAPGSLNAKGKDNIASLRMIFFSTSLTIK